MFCPVPETATRGALTCSFTVSCHVQREEFSSFHVTRTNKTCHESFKTLLFVCNMVSSLFYDTSLDTTVFISPFAGIHFNLGRLIFSLPKLREEGNVLDMRVTGRPASIIH